MKRLRVERFLQSRRMEFKVTFLLSSDWPSAYLSVEDMPELATALREGKDRPEMELKKVTC